MSVTVVSLPALSVTGVNDDQLGAAVSQVEPVSVVSARSTWMPETPEPPASPADVEIATECDM